MRTTTTLCLFLLLTTAIFGQEICDNGIDDDGDGLIDLNDDACICNAFIESSLIPNPSFEDRSCCPSANEMLNCADGWIQASSPTTDYVHTCGNYLGNTSIPAFAPLPFPDGEGAVGFRDGQNNVGSNYKEYVGACLTETMVAGTSYRLDFFVGFQDNVTGSMELDLAVFGSTSCANLPFGGNSITIGCPANTGFYDLLGQVNVSGSGEWVNVIIEFVADQSYEVLVVGPACAANPNFVFDPYFYIDRMAFAELGVFGTPFESVSGSVCEDDLVLSVTDNPDHTYQWYLDGIALAGETQSSILLQSSTSAEGTYTVAITNAEGCNLSREYELRIPPYYAPLSADICEGESFAVGSLFFDTSGYYEVTVPALDGCDSIIQLSLDVFSTTYGTLRDTICTGDTYSLYDIETSQPGVYETMLLNTAGCDSILQIDLTVIPAGASVQLPAVRVLELGATIDIEPDIFGLEPVAYEWYDAENNLISQELELTNYQTFENTFLYLASIDAYGCTELDSVFVEVDKSNIRVYVPNAFSPDNNGINDFFRFYTTSALATADVFAIYDRWGNLVYEKRDITDPIGFLGWDGLVGGQVAQQAVYAYYIQLTFIDGSQQLLEGDVVLLR